MMLLTQPYFEQQALCKTIAGLSTLISVQLLFSADGALWWVVLLKLWVVSFIVPLQVPSSRKHSCLVT